MRSENEFADPTGRPAEAPAGDQLEAERRDPMAPERPMPSAEPAPGGHHSFEAAAADPRRQHGAALEARFDELQTRFIDDPRDAVRSADSLIEEAVDRLIEDMRRRLEAIRNELGDDADTERLRIAMHHYREVLGQIAES